MWMIWLICGVIVLVILALSLFTTHKGYQYEHTVDPLPDDKDKNRNEEDLEKNNEQDK